MPGLSFTPLQCNHSFSGEKIGVHYLYSQTGKVLQDLTEESEEQVAHEEVNLDDDEDFPVDPVDRTVPAIALRPFRASAVPVAKGKTSVSGRARPKRPRLMEPERPPVTEPQHAQRPLVMEPERHPFIELERLPVIQPESPPEIQPERPPVTQPERVPVTEPEAPATRQSSPDTDSPPSQPQTSESTDKQDIPGYDKVCLLANCLLKLRSQDMPLSNTQAKEISDLWSNLDDYDKRSSKRAQRSKKPTGRFKGKGKSSTTVIEGAQSTQRWAQQIMHYLPHVVIC